MLPEWTLAMLAALWRIEATMVPPTPPESNASLISLFVLTCETFGSRTVARQGAVSAAAEDSDQLPPPPGLLRLTWPLATAAVRPELRAQLAPSAVPRKSSATAGVQSPV